MWPCHLGNHPLFPSQVAHHSQNLAKDHVTSLLDQTLRFFSREYSFFIKGITLSALGCEATYISVHPKIPK